MRPGLDSLFSSHIDVPPVLEISHDQVLNTPAAPAPDPHLSTPYLYSPSCLLPGIRGDGVLSRCELHQDDERQGENKLLERFIEQEACWYQAPQ